MMKYQMLINGEWVNAGNGRTWDVVNPATEAAVATVPFGDAADAELAIEAAHQAQLAWANCTAYERGAILNRTADLIRQRVDDLAPMTTRESGKPVAEARGEWLAAADYFEWFAEEGKRAYGRLIPAQRPGRRSYTLPAPVGVVATITAWNFPVVLPTRKWAAALAAGCTIAGRPSELTPLSAMAVANLLVEAGLPAGVFNLVNGEPAAMGQAFLQSPLVDKISFTGSQRVGRLLMRGAAESLKRLSLEMGGSAPVLIFDDVDVDWAAQLTVGVKFRNSGQVCISPTRFYVQAPIFDAYLAAVQAAAGALVLGDGLEVGVDVGPLINAAGRDKVEAFVADAAGRGANVVTGGRRPPHLARGFFYEPTVLTGVTGGMRVSCEEVFGPVMPIIPFKSEEEGLALANNTPFGLAGYLLTRDLDRATRASEGLKFGIVGVNDLLPATAEAPFGGMKQSGFGREGAVEGLWEYLETKLVSRMTLP